MVGEKGASLIFGKHAVLIKSITIPLLTKWALLRGSF